MPENTDASNFLDQAGQYHFVITAIDESPTDRNDKMVDAIELSLTVLSGTDSGQKKKKLSGQGTRLTNPNEGHRDGGEFCARIQARLALAVGILPDAKPGEMVDIDWQAAIGQQIVAFVKEDHYKDSNDNPRISYKIDGAHIYGVGDPDVAHVPKDEAALKLIGITPAVTPTTAKQPTQQPTQQPEPAAAVTAGADDFSDL